VGSQRDLHRAMVVKEQRASILAKVCILGIERRKPVRNSEKGEMAQTYILHLEIPLGIALRTAVPGSRFWGQNLPIWNPKVHSQYRYTAEPHFGLAEVFFRLTKYQGSRAA
jgi:hypothetical protein